MLTERPPKKPSKVVIILYSIFVFYSNPLPQVFGSIGSHSVTSMKIFSWTPPLALAAIFLFATVANSPAQAAQEKFDKMAAELHLSDKQKMQLAPILQEEKQQTAALKANGSLGKRQKLRQYMDIQQHFHYQAAQVLDEKQLSKLEQMQKQQRQEMLEKH
jgi:hypothetical protein